MIGAWTAIPGHHSIAVGVTPEHIIAQQAQSLLIPNEYKSELRACIDNDAKYNVEYCQVCSGCLGRQSDSDGCV